MGDRYFQMDTSYLSLKFWHVVSAIIWVGGSVSLAVTTLRLPVETDRQAALTMARHSSFYGGVVVGIASLMTFVFGISMIGSFQGGGGAFMIYGFMAIPFQILMGGIVFGFSGRRMKRLLSDPSTPLERLQSLKNFMVVSSLIYLAGLFGVVYAMVVK